MEKQEQRVEREVAYQHPHHRRQGQEPGQEQEQEQLVLPVQLV
jgi:hypothetical protein